MEKTIKNHQRMMLLVLSIIIAVGMAAFVLYRYIPNNSGAFELKLKNEIPASIELGDEVKVDALLKNNSGRSYHIQYGGQELIKIYFYKDGEKDSVINTASLARTIFFAGQSIERIAVLRPSESGTYIIKVTAEIDLGNGITQTISLKEQQIEVN